MQVHPISSPLNSHDLSIRLAIVNGFSGLLDSGQHGIVGEDRLRNNACGLRLEVDVEALDTWRYVSHSRSSSHSSELEGVEGVEGKCAYLRVS